MKEGGVGKCMGPLFEELGSGMVFVKDGHLSVRYDA